MCYVKCEPLGWDEFYVGCSCGGSVEVVGVLVFHPIRLCIEVYLRSTVLLGIQPLLLQLFLGYQLGPL